MSDSGVVRMRLQYPLTCVLDPLITILFHIQVIVMLAFLPSVTAFAPQNFMLVPVITPVASIVMQERSASIPFLKKPPALDGTLPGDVGFDPLGFSTTITELGGDLSYVREAELMHGRQAMLATVGFVFPVSLTESADHSRFLWWFLWWTCGRKHFAGGRVVAVVVAVDTITASRRVNCIASPLLDALSTQGPRGGVNISLASCVVCAKAVFGKLPGVEWVKDVPVNPLEAQYQLPTQILVQVRGVVWEPSQGFWNGATAGTGTGAGTGTPGGAVDWYCRWCRLDRPVSAVAFWLRCRHRQVAFLLRCYR